MGNPIYADVQQVVDGELVKLTDEQFGWFRRYSVTFRMLDGGDTWTWNQEDADMRALSLQFPGVLVVNEAQQSDGDGDRWRTYALDGVVETVKPEIVWPAHPFAGGA